MLLLLTSTSCCFECIRVIIGILMHIIFQFVCAAYDSYLMQCKSRRHSHCNSSVLFFIYSFLCVPLFMFAFHIELYHGRSFADMTWMHSRLLKHSSHISFNLLCSNEPYIHHIDCGTYQKDDFGCGRVVNVQSRH